jgi:putative transposase
MRSNPAGQMIQAVWDDLPNRFHCIELHAFTVMPNHIHGIIGISGRRGDPRDRPGSESGHNPTDHKQTKGEYKIRPYGTPDPGDQTNRPHGTLPETLGRVVQAFKSITTCEYIDGVKQSGWPSFPGKLWQRNYWEHIIRNDSEMVRISEYIRNNPAQWELDTLNTGKGHQPTCTVSEPRAEYAQEVWMI